MHALLSIKPRYADAIINGEKIYEFRKTLFKRNTRKVYIYSTYPIQRIVGTFDVGEIIEDHPENLWLQLRKFSGLSSPEFFSYFYGHENGFAIQIKSVKRFETPVDPRNLIPAFRPPQSFYYLTSGIISALSYHLK